MIVSGWRCQGRQGSDSWAVRSGSDATDWNLGVLWRCRPESRLKCPWNRLDSALLSYTPDRFRRCPGPRPGWRHPGTAAELHPGTELQPGPWTGHAIQGSQPRCACALSGLSREHLSGTRTPGATPQEHLIVHWPQPKVRTYTCNEAHLSSDIARIFWLRYPFPCNCTNPVNPCNARLNLQAQMHYSIYLC